MLQKFNSAKYITIHIVIRNITSRFSRNSEAFASNLPENIEEMFIGTTYKMRLLTNLNPIQNGYTACFGTFEQNLDLCLITIINSRHDVKDDAAGIIYTTCFYENSYETFLL